MRLGILTVRGRAGDEGGAERFFNGLQHAFSERGYDADVVTIPGDESTFASIEECYLRCYDFDAACFDAVISTKAPTYLVRHPNHVCYLVHTIRVFYDMFEDAFPTPTAQLLAQRALVRELDTLALAPPRTRKVFAIGREVAQRLSRSNGIDAVVMHPPLGYDRFHAGPYGDYIFLPGRLHRWKRVDLAIEAMRHVRVPLRLLISGSGEDEASLLALAAADARVLLLGRVPDDELVELYANALAVAFVPLREDYGYVTVEAFRSGKPVVTCSDSGEAAVLVEHERTGLIVASDPKSLGAAFERLHADRELVAVLGRAAATRARELSWDHVVTALAGALRLLPRSAA